MIADHYLQLKSELENRLVGLLKLGAEMQRPSDELDTIQALLRDISEPLFFVVVGEVNSGKSSLLNALFGQEFAKVDVLPATDRVYIFRYGPEEKSVDVSAKLTERCLPVPFLRDFNVVDTPGTNTMVVEHQMIAEEFLPRADVVFFVFSVANPWTQSNWEFLGSLQKTWLKNIIFVLQQIDLREPTEIDVIHRHLQDTAIRKLGFVPPIFAVSARKALLARTSGLDKQRLWSESGFAALEEQIDLIVTESSPRTLKLRSTFQAARVLSDEFARQVQTSFEVISQDAALLNRVDLLLGTRRDQMLRQVADLGREIEEAFVQTSNERTKFLRENLTWWRMSKLIWVGSAWQHDFQLEMKATLQKLMQPQVEYAVDLLDADLRGVWPQVRDLIDNQLSVELRKEFPQTVPDFARHRRDLLESIQNRLVENLGGKSAGEELAHALRQTTFGVRVAAGAALLAATVTLIAATRDTMVAGVAATVAALAVATAFPIALGQRERILRTYKQQTDPKQTGFVKVIEEQFRKAIDSFHGEMTDSLQTLEVACRSRRSIYERLLERGQQLQKAFSDLKLRLG